MASHEENRQSKRLLLSMVCLLTVVPMAAGLLMIPGAVLLTFLFDGWDGVLHLVNNWSTARSYPGSIWRRFGVGAIALIALAIPGYCWQRIFIASGYITKETIDQLNRGRWPIIGGYWKPFAYLLFSIGTAWAAYFSFHQGIWIASFFMTCGTCAFIYLGEREFSSWRRDKNEKS